MASGSVIERSRHPVALRSSEDPDREPICLSTPLMVRNAMGSCRV